MSTVTLNADDSPGTRLLKHEQELRVQFPHLSAGHARQLVREQHPDLWALHHQGEPSLEPPAATVDPAEAINERVHSLLKSGAARNRAEAKELAYEQLPEAAEAYQSGLRMPAPTSTRDNAERPVTYRTSNASEEALRRIGERMAAHGENHATAKRHVFHDDPQLARCYDQQKPLPMVVAPSRRETAVEAALVQVQKLRRELAELQQKLGHPVIKKFAQMTNSEKDAALRRYRATGVVTWATERTRVANLSQGGNRIAPPVFFDGSAGV